MASASFARQFALLHPLIIAGAAAGIAAYAYYSYRNTQTVIDGGPADPTPKTVQLASGQVSTYAAPGSLYPVDPTTGLPAPRTLLGQLFWDPLTWAESIF